jgi:hypothetical protein
MTLLLRAMARYRLGSQMKIMRTREVADMIREAFEESGCWCIMRVAMDVASVPSMSKMRRLPMPRVPNFSNLFVE